ncbi:SpoIIE family protein phosphatase [Streptomyces polygonati]|uniref:SpoIIE family protein phosphatase n=1 Tax=Streptomyces polygonati TaxID=1617087 RepID=A0ABV8HNC3_9ACTN
MAVTGEAAGGAEPGPLDAVLTETVCRTEASAGAVWVLDPDEPLLRLAVIRGIPPKFAKPWHTVSLAAPLPASDAVNDQRLVWVNSQEELARQYPRTALATPYQFALAAAPLISGTVCWGALLLLWPPTHPPDLSGREVAAIEDGSRRAAELLDDAYRAGRLIVPDRIQVLDVETAPADGSRHTAAAMRFVERLPGGSCALDLEGRVTFATSAAGELLGRDADELRGTQLWQELPWLHDPVYEDRYRAAVFSRQPASFAACRPPDRWLHFSLYPDATGISVRITPAGTGPGPRSLSRPPQPPGTTSPVKAGQLYELIHLAAALTEVVGVSDLVDLVADQIMPAFGAHGLIMFVAEADRLRVLGHRGYPADVLGRLDGLPVDTVSSPAGRTLTTGTPAYFADVAEIKRHYTAPALASGKQAWAFLPLIVSGRPVGCCVLSYTHPHQFPPDERAVLASLAGLIAQALDRARLYDTKQRLAQGLQKALLPHTLPTVPGLEVAARYLPSTRGMDIGGDFYDLIRLGPASYAAVIGDVQGHNVAAAALMGQVRTAVHAYATAGARPDQVLDRTNRLLADLDPGLFTSCLYAQIDIGAHRVLLANAGHPPPLLRDPDRSTRVVDLPPGMVLGIRPDTAYSVTEVPLPPGALLLLHTDGLVETPGVDLDKATADLARLLASADAEDLDQLTDSLLQHTRPPSRRSDDIALLLLRATST